MRKILSILGIILSLSITAQIRTGSRKTQKIFKNTLSSKAMKTKKKNLVYSYGSTSSNKQFNKNFLSAMGTSEVFIGIPNPHYYTIELNAVMMSSPYGKFRFFEVQEGTQVLTIYRNGYLIYKTYVNIEPHSRMILEFIEGKGLFLIDILGQMDNGGWYGEALTGALMSPKEFKRFMHEMEKNTSFDKDKREFLDVQLVTGRLFTTPQIKKILSTFSFDDHRLKTAAKMFDYCDDIENYYLLENTFSFTSTKRKFRKMLKQKMQTL